MLRIILFLAIAITLNSTSFSQNETKADLKIFLDCSFCDESYFRQNLSNVEFVRDRKVAEVHLMFISQQNGSGGSAQQIQFIGLGEYKNMIDTLSYSIDVNMTSDERRKLQLRYVELGLIRYWLQRGLADEMDFSIHTHEDDSDSTQKDPWNYWVFGINVGAWANGQETYHSINANGSLSAKRITEKNKFSLRGGYNRNFQKYTYDSTVTTANQQSSWFDVQEVITINDHWSYGFFAMAGNSIYSNYRFYAEPSAGIEYNIFPYTESSTKQLTIGYEAGLRYNDYYDTTVFNQDTELLGFHRATIGGSVKQPWGNLTTTLAYHNFLHDFKLNSASIWMNLNVRLFKGFSLRLNGGFDVLHNQINLKKADASFEDVLLQQQQLGTGYSYWMSTGLNYSFGSIYNSVVNPRFDF